jgi:hypothetical protein
MRRFGAREKKTLAIVPAQPDWYILDRGEGEFRREPIVAWEIVQETLDLDDDMPPTVMRKAIPITINWETNFDAYTHVVCAPDGRFISANGNEFRSFDKEADAWRYVTLGRVPAKQRIEVEEDGSLTLKGALFPIEEL